MKIRFISIPLFCTLLFPFFALANTWKNEIVISNTNELSANLLDSVFNKVVVPEQISSLLSIQDSIPSSSTEKTDSIAPISFVEKSDSIGIKQDTIGSPQPQIEIPPFEPIILDTMVFARNPLFSRLVYMGKDIHVNWRKNNVDYLFYGKKSSTLDHLLVSVEIQHPAEILKELRQDARDHITQTAPELYKTTFDRLPQINWNQQYQSIEITPMEQLLLEDNHFVPFTTTNRIVVRKRKASPWQGKANVLLQFSQTSISENWHKGGTDFFSLLSVLSGNMNYDNKKKVKWENNFEWRTGFNTIEGDTIGHKGGRKAMPSDDSFKLNSKFGLKATGNFYYSTSMEFQTQLFDNPRGINNYEMKARLLTPIRLNIGIGMDYKYKKLSVALSPLSLKYIYLADTIKTADGFFINPKTFGIEEGENHLKEFGSKLIVQLADYKPIPELKINSKFNFYTNYEKVEIDWEIVAELAFNRFFSTRLMLNPRFDNTAILDKKEEKVRIQMKEMLTVGFSYRLY